MINFNKNTNMATIYSVLYDDAMGNDTEQIFPTWELASMKREQLDAMGYKNVRLDIKFIRFSL